MKSIDCFRIVLILMSLAIAGCATSVRISQSELRQMHELKIVRFPTPIITKSTWTNSMIRTAAMFSGNPVARENYREAIKSNPTIYNDPVVLPEKVLDFGEVLSVTIKNNFLDGVLDSTVVVDKKPIVSIEQLPSQNFFVIQYEKFVVSGAGELVAVVRFKIIDRQGKLRFETVGVYNGLFESHGDDFEKRLSKGASFVEEEYTYAANKITRDLMEEIDK